MIQYKTLKEKAEEWDIPLRHLQYLCNKGRIEGVVKKAGAWFIPDTASAPVQHTKVKNGHFNFTGTKKKIFDCAIELFQLKGVEAVSIKDIADAAGITQSSIYNHFQSKQKLVDTLYDFYCYYFLKDRPRMEDIETILQNGSLSDIMSSTTYNFGEAYVKQMTGITGIIFHRSSIDGRARELTQSLMIDEGIRFVETVFDRAVEIGRIAPVDTYSMALLINSIRIFMLHEWLASPTEKTASRVSSDEQKLYQLTANLLTDLRASDKDPRKA